MTTANPTAPAGAAQESPEGPAGPVDEQVERWSPRLEEAEQRWARFRAEFKPGEYDVDTYGAPHEGSPLRRTTLEDLDRIHRRLWDAGLLSPDADDRDWVAARVTDPCWLVIVFDDPVYFDVLMTRAHLDADGEPAVRVAYIVGSWLDHCRSRLMAAVEYGALDFGLGFVVATPTVDLPPSRRGHEAYQLEQERAAAATLEALETTPEEAESGLAALLASVPTFLERGQPHWAADSLEAAHRHAQALAAAMWAEMSAAPNGVHRVWGREAAEQIRATLMGVRRATDEPPADQSGSAAPRFLGADYAAQDGRIVVACAPRAAT